MTAQEFIINKSIPEPNTGCWFWMGTVNWKGYGTGSFEGIKFGAHRLSYSVFKGEIPKGLLVCHTCDQRSCVNPDHLWTGTPKQNTDDMMKKGRHIILETERGEKSRLAKLKDQDVLEIRRLGKLGVKAKEIAPMFGCTVRNIHDILAGSCWKHLLEESRLAKQEPTV